jgi:hypothetical protein
MFQFKPSEVYLGGFGVLMYALGLFCSSRRICRGLLGSKGERVYALINDTHDEHVEVPVTWFMKAWLCW